MKTKEAFIGGAALIAAAILATPVLAKGGSGGGGSGGGGGGGGGTTCDTTPVLPTLAPFPDIVIRESFGPGPNNLRPNGGKGCNQTTYLHTDLNGYWAEWSGDKHVSWIAPSEVNQTWRLCAVSSNIYEMPSPLQGVNNDRNGCIASDWFDRVLTRPTALLPFTQPSGAYEMHLDMWPGLGDSTYYEALGVTDSAILDRNLETSGGLWFELGYPDPPASLTGVITLTYNVRVNGRNGPVLATGTAPWTPWMPVNLRYDPVTGNASASLNGLELGTWSVGAIRTPKYVGIEGVGNADNLVVRTVPSF